MAYSLSPAHSLSEALIPSQILAELNRPYLCAVPLVFQSFEEWKASELGLHPIQVLHPALSSLSPRFLYSLLLDSLHALLSLHPIHSLHSLHSSFSPYAPCTPYINYHPLSLHSPCTPHTLNPRSTHAGAAPDTRLLTPPSPLQVALQVSLPEIDGAIEPVIYGGRDGVTGRTVPLPDRINLLADRALKWANLVIPRPSSAALLTAISNPEP